MNGQMDHLIQDATSRLADKGAEADLRDIMLAGFGYMVKEIRRPHSIMEGKKGLVAGVGAGGTGVGLVELLLRMLGV